MGLFDEGTFHQRGVGDSGDHDWGFLGKDVKEKVLGIGDLRKSVFLLMWCMLLEP
jgi:hypothetical protein